MRRRSQAFDGDFLANEFFGVADGEDEARERNRLPIQHEHDAGGIFEHEVRTPECTGNAAAEPECKFGMPSTPSVP
jgi:hypothetical protein